MLEMSNFCNANEWMLLIDFFEAGNALVPSSLLYLEAELAMVEMQEEETGKAEIFMCSFKIRMRDLDHIKSLIWTFFQFI